MEFWPILRPGTAEELQCAFYSRRSETALPRTSQASSIHDKSGEIAGQNILFMLFVHRKSFTIHLGLSSGIRRRNCTTCNFVYVTLAIKVSFNEDQICSVRSCWDPRQNHDYVTILSPSCNLEKPQAWHILQQSCSPVTLSDPVNGLMACLEPSRYFPVCYKLVSSIGLEPSGFHLNYCIAHRRHLVNEYDVQKLMV